MEVHREVQFVIEHNGENWFPTGRFRYFKHPRVQDKEGEEIPFDFAFVLQQQLWRPPQDPTSVLIEKVWVDVPEVEE